MKNGTPNDDDASPRSLIPIGMSSVRDVHYDLQLARCLELSQRLDREERIRLDRVSAFPRTSSTSPAVMHIHSVDGTPATEPANACNQSVHVDEEELDMNLMSVGAAALIASATLVGGSAHGEPRPRKDVPASVKLGPEYKKIELFQEFREKLIADGWTPKINPDCHDAVKGDFYDKSCSKDPGDISCRLCEITPELFRMTSDGYLVMEYIKSGVSLSVTLYGDIQDFDHPGEYGLSIVGWDYEAGMNVQLLD